jgi:GT2 family glycosyltransferase
MKISVIIPTYNNPEFFENFKINWQYLNGLEIVIVNDNPQNNIEDLFKEFIGVKIIKNKINLGFSKSVNNGVKHSSGDYLLLLNDDVVLKDKSYTKAIEYFKNDIALFAVSFCQLDKSGKTTGRNKIFFKNGFFMHQAWDSNIFGINGWAEGGSSLIDRKKYDELGGFDELYSPFYWEDIDLSYRAWKSGFKIFFDPKIIVYHHHETTIAKNFKNNKIKSIAYRNQLIFIWKNITSLDLSLLHFGFLLKKIMASVLKRDTAFLIGFISSIFKSPTIINERFNVKYTLTDHDILSKFKK